MMIYYVSGFKLLRGTVSPTENFKDVVLLSKVFILDKLDKPYTVILLFGQVIDQKDNKETQTWFKLPL